MQGFMKKAIKKRAPTPVYVSPAQLSLGCFKTPFEQHLNFKNRWVVLAHLIPWDEVCNLYLKHVGVSDTGRPPLNPRVVLGSLIIKHICNLDDRETVDQISENVYPDSRDKLCSISLVIRVLHQKRRLMHRCLLSSENG
jgi:hypothetical protein